MRSQLAACRSWAALTKEPGRSCTALRKVAKSPPVSGARKMRACCASAGTVTKIASSRAVWVQVSTRVNQSTGGGLVVPRRNATTSRKGADWLSGRWGGLHNRSPASRLAGWLMDRVALPRVSGAALLRGGGDYLRVLLREKPGFAI